MKKFIGTVLFVFLFFSMTFVPSNAIIIKATDSVDNNSNASIVFGESLSESEYNSLSTLINQKLNLASFEYEIISSFNSPNRYVLVEGDNCYLIYDRVLSDYIEYTNSSNSVYSLIDNNKTKIYLSPTYYYSLDQSGITDIMSNQKMSLTEIQKLQNIEEELRINYINNQNEIAKSEPLLNLMNRSTDDVYIPYEYYFMNLQYNIGPNVEGGEYEGSCSYVAVEMVLSYFDTVKNDNIIGESYDITEDRYFARYDLINPELYISSPGIDDNFHDYLIRFGRKQVSEASTQYTSMNNFVVSTQNMPNLMEDYLNTRGFNNISKYYLNSNSVSISACISAINAGNPIIITIEGQSGAVDLGNKTHSVVGYGYNNTGVFANFGWSREEFGTDGDGNTVNLRHMNLNHFTINCASYITINNTSHLCSNNYTWRSQSCSGTICPCGTKTCNHANKTYTSYNNTQHRVYCAVCGAYTELSNHSFTTSGDMKTCTLCGYSIEVNHTHSYRYTYKSMNRHTKSCACGYSTIEGCMWVVSDPSDPKICARCGHTVEE